MSKLNVIEFAYKRLQESCDADEDHLIAYWRAYLDGAIAQKKEDLKERETFLMDVLGKEVGRNVEDNV